MKKTLLFLLSLSAIFSVTAQVTQPNVIIFYTDDLGWQDTELNQDAEFDNNEAHADIVDVFANGTKALAETPNILKLAGLGANFSQAYSPAPSCAPSRTAMMSGHHTTQTEMTHVGGGQIPEPNSNNANSQMIPPFYPGRLALDEISIAEALTPSGYTTGSVGKWHMAVKNNAYPEAIDQGFDFHYTGRGVHQGMGDRHDLANFGGEDSKYPLDADGRPYDQVTEEALGFLEANKSNPFFLYMATWLVHAPIQTRDLAWLNYYRDKLGMTGDFVDDGTITAEGQNNPYFASMVATMDWSLGRVIDYLETTDDPRHTGKKLIETTYIIFSSDNGAVETVSGEVVTDNYPLDEGKKHIQEGGVRTPLVIAGPGITGGQHFTNVVSHLDFFPTILEWTGANATVSSTIQNKLDGVSLAPFLAGTTTQINQTGSTNERTDLYWHFPNGPDDTMQSSIRSGVFKLYHNHLDDSYELYQLYDEIDGSNVDIEEANDISSTNTAVTDAMKIKLDNLLAQHPHKFPQWNANYTGSPSLDNADVVPSVASTSYNQASSTVIVTMTEDETKANIVGGYLIYTIDGLDKEEWFQGDESLTIVNDVITADVPENATAVVLNLIDENNFGILTDQISTVSTAAIVVNTINENQTFEPENEDVYSELIGGTSVLGSFLQMKTTGGGDGVNFNIIAGDAVVCDSITFNVRSLIGDTANFSISLADITQSFEYTSINSKEDVSFVFNTPVSLSEATESMQFLLTNLTNSGAGISPRFRIYDVVFHIDLNTVGQGLIASVTLDEFIEEQNFQPESEDVYSELVGSTTVGGNFLQTRTEGGGDGFNMNVAATAPVVCDKIRIRVRSLEGDTANFDVTVGNTTQSFEYVSTSSTNNEYYEFNTPVTFTEGAKAVEFLVSDLTNLNSIIPRFRIYDVTFYLASTAATVAPELSVLGEVADVIIDQDDNQELRLSPNPVKDVFYLNKEITSGTLFNINGQIVFEFKEVNGGIDISNLNSGLYVLKVVYSDNKEEYLKLIKE